MARRGWVPGSSKGCTTCRKRKIRCDELHPFCARCAKSGLVCGGYRAPGMRFVNMFGVHVESPDATSSSSSSESSPSELTAHPQKSSLKSTSIKAWKTTTLPSPPSIKNIDPTALTISQFLANFVPLYVPSPDILGGTWVKTWPAMLGKSGMLDAAVYAYALVSLGYTKGDGGLVNKSSGWYGRALRSCVRENAKGRGVNADMMSTSVALAKYEFFNTTSILPWASHHLGFTAMLLARGPPDPSNPASPPLDAGLWQLLRFTAIATSISSRKATFLSNPEWIGIEYPGVEAMLTNRLLDIAASIPTLLEDIDILFASSQQPTTTSESGNFHELDLSSVLTLSHNISTRLATFLLALQSSFPERASGSKFYWPAHSPGDSELQINLDAPFAEPLQFEDLSTCKIMLFYWAYNICLDLAVLDIIALTPTSTHNKEYRMVFKSEDIEVQRHEHVTQAASYASLICRAVPFSMKVENGMSHTHSAIWPLSVAMGFWKEVDEVGEEFRWCVRRMDELEQRGFAWGKRFGGLDRRNYRIGELGEYIRRGLGVVEGEVVGDGVRGM